MNRNSLFPRIPVVGGPCGGKTTYLNFIKERLLNEGFYPLIAPEVATQHLGGGITFDHLGDEDFQYLVLASCLHQEAQYVYAAQKMVQKGARPVVVFDRGIFDGAAYIGKGDFRKTLTDCQVTNEQEVLYRYDMVIQFEVAPERYFSSDSNSLRYETSHARGVEIETVIRPYYEIHPEYYFGSNVRGGFNVKIRKAVDHSVSFVKDFYE